MAFCLTTSFVAVVVKLILKNEMAYYIKYIKVLIQVNIPETLQELLDNPDWGKEPKQKIKQRLSKSLKQTEVGSRHLN